VRLLIDTHVFLWWDRQPVSISPSLLAAIGDDATDIFVSAASVWEIAIKRAIGKLGFSQRIVGVIAAHGFTVLPVTGEHAEHAGELPRHHADPFDRLLVAQAYLERMILGTQDPRMSPYGVPTLGLDRS
jgi:PIN domain nuclease of toxin-antitoxin system